MKNIITLLFVFFTTCVAHAVVVFEDDFSSYTGGTIWGADWNPKWDGNTNNVPLQQDLMTATNGISTLDTSKAWRNYHVPSTHGFSVLSNYFAVVGSDFRYHYSGGAITIANKPAFGLLLTTTPDWWSGVNKTLNVANRGAAIGNPLPVAPWIEGWLLHSSRGIADYTSTAADTSNWFRIEWTITQGASNYMASAKFLDMGGNSFWSTTEIDLGIANGTTLYAGYSPGYNDVGNTNIASFSHFDQIDMDNFKVEVTKIPSTRTIFSDDFENPSYTTYPTISWWQNLDPWNKALNHEHAYMITNGVCRANMQWRGAGNSTYPVAASTGEIIRVAYDLSIDLNNTFATYILGDYMLVQPDAYTNTWTTPAIYYDGTSASSGLARRISFNAWTGGSGEYPNGRMVINLNGGAAEYYPAEDVGLSPGTGGDYVSDPLRVTFEYTKKTVAGQWECVTLISNMSSSVTLTTTQNLSNAEAWSAPELFYCMQNSGMSGGAFWELDNFIVQVSSGPEVALVGYDAWADQYPLEDLTDRNGDNDNDGLSNFGEWVFGGVPNDGDDQGASTAAWDAASGQYMFSVLQDDSLTISVLTNIDLVSGGWGVHDTIEVPLTTDSMKAYTNSVGTSADQVFIKLEVSQ